MALVIIDAQYAFDPEASKAEQEILKLIRGAKSRREAIFVVAFSGWGSTLASILDAVRGYPLVFYVRKSNIDGASPLAAAIRRAWKRGLIQAFSKLRFCGVYTSQCVRHTMFSLSEIAAETPSPPHKAQTALGPDTEIELVTKACADDWDEGLGYVKDQARQHKQVRVV